MSSDSLPVGPMPISDDGLHLSKYPIAIVIPIHNDWTSAQYLVTALDRVLSHSAQPCHVILVDDGSTERPMFVTSVSWIKSIRIVRLAVNLGHQRAISVGLTVAAELNVVSVVVMDGEKGTGEICGTRRSGVFFARLRKDDIEIGLSNRPCTA